MLQYKNSIGAVANCCGAMEAETISKNGRSLKSQMSRKLFFFLTCFALITCGAFIFTACEDKAEIEKKGSITFWTADKDGGSWKIEIEGLDVDGERSGTLSKYQTSGSPVCGESGLTFSGLTYGSYLFKAKNSIYEASGLILVDQSCQLMELDVE